MIIGHFKNRANDPPLSRKRKIRKPKVKFGEGNGNHTPVFLLGKFHGQRNLVGYSPWGCKSVGNNLATKQQP